MATRDPAVTGTAIATIAAAAVALWRRLVKVEPILLRVEDKECQKQLAEMRAMLSAALVKVAHLEGEVALLRDRQNRSQGDTP